MAATTTSETYDALWTLTMRAKRKRLTDNISDAYPTIAEFRKAGMIETENGGKQIAEDLMYALASSEFFDTYDVLNTDSIDGITQAHYDWSYMATPIVISMTEERENRASDKAIKLLEAKTTQAMQGALDQANQTALSAATGKAFLGLQDICAESTGATVGGINSTNETWWESQRFDFDATHTSFDTKVGDSYEGVLGMSALWNDLTEGNEQPNLIITEYEVYEDYENIFESGLYLRTTPGSRNNVDGRNPAYRGAKVIPDRDCPTGNLYMLNTKFLKFKVQAGMNFSKTPFKEPANQLAKVSFVVLGCQLVTNHRARQGLMYDIVTT